MSAIDDLGISAVFTSHSLPSTESLSNLVSNPGFEIAASPLDSWTVDDDDGAVTVTRTVGPGEFRSGFAAAKMVTNVGGDTLGHIYQDITVTGKTSYHLTFWTKIEDIYATMQARFAIYDNTNGAWIITRENAWGVDSNDWQQTSRMFTTPTGCISIRLYFYQNIDGNNGNTSYVVIDDVSIVKRSSTSAVTLPGLAEPIQFNSYRHSHSASGGYDSMQIAFPARAEVITGWLENGLLRFVEVNDGSGQIWAGFVNTIKITFGATTIQIGPITDIINRGRMLYKTLSWDTVPPIEGDDVKSIWHNESESQDLYGVWEGTFSGGERDVAQATQALKTATALSAWPATQNSGLVLGGGAPLVTIEALGLYYLFKSYFYTNTGEAGQINLSTKLTRILDSNPNAPPILNVRSIVENTTQVGAYEDGDKRGLDLITSLVALGDASFNRYLFGVSDSGVFYKQAPTGISYLRDVETGVMSNIAGEEVDPWRIEAGLWARHTGRKIWHGTDGNAERSKSQDMFLEKVTYTAPYGLSLTESMFSTARSRLAQIGIGGV